MIKQKTYHNGLKLFVNKNKTLYTTFAIGVKCGSINESENEFGLSHFIEHLFFKSTKSTKTAQLLSELEFNGAHINACTSYDFTYYHFTVINENFERCFQIYCDMFFNGIYEKTEVDMERNVILEEFKRSEDSSQIQLMSESRKRIFKNTPYEHKILGTEEVIKKATIKQIKAYRKALYCPEKIIICSTGGMSFKKIDKLVKTHFLNNFKQGSKSKNKSKKLLKMPELSDFKNKCFKIQKTDKQVHLRVFIKSVAGLNKLLTVQSFYRRMMGNGHSSRMFAYLREQQGLAYSVGTSYDDNLSGGYISFFITTSPEKVEQALEGIKFLINDAAENGFNENELLKTKTNLKSNLITTISNSSLNKSMFYSSLYAKKKLLTIKDNIKLINRVTLQDVNDFAKTVADEKNVLVSAIGDNIDLKVLKKFFKSNKKKYSEDIKKEQ